MHRIFLEAPCHPTEGTSKVMTALLSIFPDAVLDVKEGKIMGEAKDLSKLGDLLRNQRIRGSAREVFEGSVRGGRIVFHLNKQAAYLGKVSFSALSPLGDILVSIEADNVGALIEQLAPAHF